MVGLVTLNEMKARREDLVREHEKKLAAQLKQDKKDKYLLYTKFWQYEPWHCFARASQYTASKTCLSIPRNNKDKKKKLAKISSGLSFNIDGEDEDVDEDDIEPAGMWVQMIFCVERRVLFKTFPSFLVKKKKKPGKNPDVDTSFLPDKDREV